MSKNSKITAGFVGFSMLLAACSGEGDTPDALSFQDDSSGSTEVETVNRPTGNPCSQNGFSVAFDNSVVLLDPDSIVQGPFDIDLPAGTYDIVVSTWLGLEELPEQTMEQWYFTTDSGYTSPTTNDYSPSLLMNQEFQSQTIGETTTVTLHHKAPGADTINSVHPLCIGFTVAEVAETTTTATTESPDTTTTEAPEVTDSGTANENAGAEVPADETDDTADVVAETTTTSTTTTTAAPATAEDAPELALTGPSELAMSLGLTGTALILAGSAATVAARRSEEA